MKTLTIFLFVLFFSTFILAQTGPDEIPVNATKGNLHMSISPTAVDCSETPCVREFNLSIRNPSIKSIKLRMTERVGDVWVPFLEIGNLSPGESTHFIFTRDFNYPGESKRTGLYAIISDTLLSTDFTITENWIEYESRSKELLMVGGFAIAPTILFALLAVLYFVSRQAEHRPYLFHPGEFTMANLFLPPKGTPPKERLALALTSPFLWATVLFFSFLLMFVLTFVTYQDFGLLAILQIALISFVSAALIPVLLMIIAWFGDVYEREPFRFIVGMFSWGILSAFIAFFLNGLLVFLFSSSIPTIPVVLLSMVAALVISPVIEELTKGIGIAIISRHHEFDDVLDGLLYGFVIGIGFAAMENWFYFVSRVNPLTMGFDVWVYSILYRSFFNTLGHGFFTAFLGAMVAKMKSIPKFRNFAYLAFLPGVFIAILLHMFFNFTALIDVISVNLFSRVSLLFNPLVVLLAGIVFLVIYYFGLREARKKFEKLNKKKKN